jgi:hypothetical protein
MVLTIAATKVGEVSQAWSLKIPSILEGPSLLFE